MRWGWLVRIALFAASLAIGLGVAEAASRVLRPIETGAHYTDERGEPVQVLADDGLLYRPGLRYRQVGAEYDVWNTITPQGHRVPEVEGSPEVVFLGDSFTFGFGVGDDENFVARYCRGAEISCANLGLQSSGTGEAADIAEEYIGRRGWRPRVVNLFMLVMTGSLLTGNDLADNFVYSEGAPARRAATNDERPRDGSPFLTRFLVSRRQWLLTHSNLVRLVYLQLGPELRRRLSPDVQAELLEEALRRTRVQLRRLARLSRRYDFELRIFLLHPMQDLLRGTQGETLNAIRRVAPPGVPVTDTAEALLDDPRRYYYPFDGHLGAEGHAKIAAWLASHAR